MQKQIFRAHYGKWLSSLLFLASLSGCGGGSEAASSPALPSAPQKTPGLPPAPTPIPTPPSQSIPTAKFDCAVGAITCVEVASTSSQPQPSLPVTFGQPFKAGDWLYTTQGLVAKVDGATIPLQTDEISSHRDGSARFAVLSAQLSNVQPGETRIINLYTGAKTSSPTNAPADPDWNLEVETQVYDANGNVTATLVAQPQAQLKDQIASNNGRRLNGAVASEYTVVTDFKDKATGARHPHLSARFHTRLVDGGARIRTDVVMENTRTWTNAPGNITYSMAIKRNGVTLYSQPKFTHYHHARWHKVVWSGSSAQPQVRVRHQMPYFIASKAVWNYDLALQIPENVLANQYALLNQRRSEQAALGPMGNMLLTPSFPTTGGRAEIGPLPEWTATYLISQDSRALESMLANTDAAAAVPIHYRDDVSGQPLDLDRHPNVSTARGTSEPLLPTLVNGNTIWDPDTAHQASFAYVPYLLTGDAFYQDELMFWAAWNFTYQNPAYREHGNGILREDQVRAQAWMMRGLGEVARSLPESHAMKSYFKSKLTTNLEWFYKNLVTNPDASAVSPMGTPVNPYDQYTTAPWQNDFLGIVMAQLAENGEPKALELLQWLSRFNVGRFINESQGYCVSYAPGYYLKLRNSNDQFINNWRELFQVNFPEGKCSDDFVTGSYPTWAGGAAAYARAMLATAASVGIADAAQAYNLWAAKTSGMNTDFQNDPTWAIVPRP